MCDLMNDILEGRLIYRIPKERMSASLDLYEMRAFKQFHGRWPLRSDLEDTLEPLPALTTSAHGEGAPTPALGGEIASESDTLRLRTIWILWGVNQEGDWTEGFFSSPEKAQEAMELYSKRKYAPDYEIREEPLDAISR